MTVSTVTLESVKQSLRIDYDYDDEMLLSIMDAAKGYMMSQMSLTAEELDKYPEMVYAFCCICGSMHNERTMNAENVKPNQTAENIMAMHSPAKAVIALLFLKRRVSPTSVIS